MFVPRRETLAIKQPLKYLTGAEVADTVVVDYTTVSADGLGRRIIIPGELFTKITASGKYGPYDGAETDGREAIEQLSAVIMNEGDNVELGDKALGGWYHNCVFDVSELDLFAASLNDTPLRDAFPKCVRDD